MVVRHLTYHVIIERDEELPPGAPPLFVASVPSLPGCFSQGDTLEEAKANIRGAISSHLKGLAAMGREIPHPDSALEEASDVTIEFAA